MAKRPPKPAEGEPVAAEPNPVMAEDTPNPETPVVEGESALVPEPAPVEPEPELPVLSNPYPVFNWGSLVTRIVTGPSGGKHGVKIRKNDDGTLTVKPWSYEGAEVTVASEEEVAGALNLYH